MIDKLQLDYLSFGLDNNPHFNNILNQWVVIGYEWGDRDVFLSHINNNAICVVTANNGSYEQKKTN